MNKTSIKSIIMCATFSAMIIVGAYIRIPIPPVPLTMQTFFVLLSGMVLGPRLGVCSVLIYIALGVVGLPVFSGGTAGISSIMMPTFGYAIGFIPAVYVSGRISGNSYKSLLLSALVAMSIIYVCGTGYYLLLEQAVMGNDIRISEFLISFFALSIPKDVAVCFAVATIAKRLRATL